MTKSKKKEEIKTAQAYNAREVTIYRCSVACPSCGVENDIEEIDCKPRVTQCYFCLKQFNIEWE